MSLPHDEEIQSALLTLLASKPNGKMACEEIYVVLAKKFPLVTNDELTAPYRSSRSHWANRVQFARLHLVKKKLLLHPTISGRGIWAISEEGRASLKASTEMMRRLLEKFDRTAAQ